MNQLLVMKKYLIISILSFCCITNLNAQDVVEMYKAKLFSMSGYLSLSGNTFLTTKENKVRSPFGYNIAGGININLKGFNIPFNFIYSDQQKNYSTRTFSRLGLSPQYKWIKLHIGRRSMNFSPYIYSGTTFNGVGIELTPGKFNLSVFRGNLDQSFFASTILEDAENAELNNFKRSAFGARLGFGSASSRLDLYAFKATDDPLSANIDSLSLEGITPGENVAVGLSYKQNFFNKMTLDLNIGTSALTSSLNARPVSIDSTDLEIVNRFSSILQVNSSSRYAVAYDARIGFNLSPINIGFTYQHIDPFYSTFGINFINSDLDNYLVDLRMNLFRGRFALNSSFGRQFNNTKDYLVFKDSRNIGSLNLNWKVSDKFSIAGNYNNFSQSSARVQEVQILDSIQIASVNHSLGSNLSYRLGSKENRHTLSMSIMYSVFDTRDREVLIAQTNTKSYNLNWKQTRKQSKLTYGLGLSRTNFTSQSKQVVQRLGANARLSKRFGNSFRFGITGNYKVNSTDNQSDGNVFGFGFNTGFKMPANTSFSLTTRYMRRNTSIITPFSDLSGRAQIRKQF